MATESDIQALTTNGHGMPVDWQGVPDDVIRRMELAYEEIQRRDARRSSVPGARTKSCNIWGLSFSLWWGSCSGWCSTSSQSKRLCRLCR